MNKAIYVPILLSMLAASFSAHAEMYKWTDKSGKTHYTATPPPADAEGKDIEQEIRLSTGKLGNTPPQATNTAAEPKNEMEQAREDGKKSEEKHHDFCNQQSDALKQMTANSLIKWKDAQGERFLTADEKTKKMKEIEQNLESMCKPEMFNNTPDRQVSQTEAAVGGRFAKDQGSTLTGSGSSGGAAGDTGSSSNSGPDSSTGNAPSGSLLPATN